MIVCVKLGKGGAEKNDIGGGWPELGNWSGKQKHLLCKDFRVNLASLAGWIEGQPAD